MAAQLVSPAVLQQGQKSLLELKQSSTSFHQCSVNIQLSRLQLAYDPRKLPFCFIFSNAKERLFLGKSCCLIYLLNGPDVRAHAAVNMPTDVPGYMHLDFCTSPVYNSLFQGRGLIGCTAAQEGPVAHCQPWSPWLAPVLCQGLATLLNMELFAKLSI